MVINYEARRICLIETFYYHKSNLWRILLMIMHKSYDDIILSSAFFCDYLSAASASSQDSHIGIFSSYPSYP